MDVSEAHRRLSLCEAAQRGIWPFPTDYSIKVVDGGGEEFDIRCDGWPIAAAAAALFSGDLDDAQTPDDLQALVGRTRARIERGEIDLAALADAWNRVAEVAQAADEP